MKKDLIQINIMKIKIDRKLNWKSHVNAIATK